MQTNVQLSSVTRENFSPMELTTEDIHLTELLPVKQSAIRCCENQDEKGDEIVTDAFKALREVNKEFTLGRNESFQNNVLDEEYAANSGNTGKRNETFKRRSGEEANSKKRIKRNVKRKELGGEQERNNEKGKQDADQRRRKNGGGVSVEKYERENFRDRISPKRVEDYEEESDGSELEPIDRSGMFNDEIYVFRQEKSADSREARDKSQDGTEESLREKIDAIIQANYMMEGKNNNTMRENRNKTNAVGSDGSETDLRNSGDESSDKKHRCAICDARFKGSGGLRTHYKVVHAAGPMFTCNECGKGFPLKERLKLHVRTHTGYKPYKCSECEKSFARGGQLVQHRRTHTQVKPYRCVLCPGTFSCAANLALHVKRHNGQKDHKCDICGRAFVRRDALKKHLECLHKDVKSFLCVICNKTFKGHLPQHMRTHAQDRPHGCATCGQRFAQKSQLTVHQRTHSGQRPFRCLVCWQAFAHSTALKLHTRRHTGERPFKCAECSAGFTQLPHWKKHMRCVHGRTDPYCCKNCNTFFRIKNDLETHEKSCIVGEPIVEDQEGENRGRPVVPKYRIMTVEKMRLLLAVLFKRISKPERLDELGFGKRLIDEVLKDSLLLAGKEPVEGDVTNEFDSLKQNLTTFLEWTVPTEHWEAFKKLNKSPEEILETLTVSQ